MRRYKLLGFLVTSLLVAFLVACQNSPTGRSQFILIGDEQMNDMGIQSFEKMKEQTPPSTDKKQIAYVTCISEALLRANNENVEEWEIQVFKEDSPNAFALPGKKIGVHTGMIDLAGSPDQLAAVIGHEIGHVKSRHGAERVSLGLGAAAVQTIAQFGLQDNENSQLIMAAIGLGSQFGVLLPYSRSHETEADLIGLDYMARAGFNPKDSVELWKNMAKASGGKGPLEFMSTHPSHDTRIDTLNENMKKALKKYQKALDNNIKPACNKP